MKLNLSQIETITRGVVRITEQEDGFHFHRFTEEQEELYSTRTERNKHIKVAHTSGVKMHFKTNSKNLYLKLSISGRASRSFFSCEVLVNGKRVDTINNFSNIEIPDFYSQLQLPLGDFEKHFDLGEGLKELEIYLPWSVNAVIGELSLDDNSVIEQIKYERKLLAFGDSITQGFDSLYPSNKYITKLSKFLGAEEFNKAIGAEIFFPELAKTKENFVPDYIVVAYGSNNWNFATREQTVSGCRNFYKNLSENYPDTKIFALTPVWRKDLIEYRPFGDFMSLEEIIKDSVKDLKNVIVVKGFDFVPKEEKYFADLRLHPNDEGFERYFLSLKEAIKNFI